MNFKKGTPLFFSLEVVNKYFFAWDKMEAVGECIRGGELDALHGLSLLEITPEGNVIGGEFKENYRGSRLSYKGFLAFALKREPKNTRGLNK